MFLFQHFLPKGSQLVHRNESEEVKAMAKYIISRINDEDVPIPGTEMEVSLTHASGIPMLWFKKNDEHLYLHVFCFDCESFWNALYIASIFYVKNNLGCPRKPPVPNWIHTIPMKREGLTSQEILLIFEITQSIYWAMVDESSVNRGMLPCN